MLRYRMINGEEKDLPESIGEKLVEMKQATFIMPPTPWQIFDAINECCKQIKELRQVINESKGIL